MIPKTILAVLAAGTLVQGGVVERRRVVNHDSIAPFPESVPNTATGNTYRKFEPYLHIAHGCQSYPAVASNGDDTGSSTGGCRDQSKGQTYVRGGWHNGRYGIMYAWYMPKDMPNSGVSTGSHRHDWENVVVWVDNPAVANPTMLGGAASGHGKYKKTKSPQKEGTRPKVEYFTNFPTNHELQFTNTLGRDLPLIAWESLPGAARKGLEDANFKDATVPFKDSTFQGNLAKAAL
ncbi:NPP1 domain protein [Aspergillus bombycis]|uniref:NPP1 domain protein n=1 Tax=Aspergillus bombycis TaxID=109264 RepID=A0A1F8A0C9_9EURO|nr:NPP1 domain protein [Aspergillus bombycis]OGM45137.1 NPP1 domain protein [Aspergillus bombycis]